MNRSRLLTTIAAAALGASLFSACGAITERAVEFGVEQAVEADTGEDFDLDLSDGSFTISTDEGDIAFNVDADGENGSIVFDTEDGSGAINFDQDEGTVVFDTEDGRSVVNFDEDGANVTVDGEDLASIWGINREAPDNWHPLIGVPASYDESSAIFRAGDDGGTTIYSMNVQDVDPSYPAELAARLTAAGLVGEVAENIPTLTTYTGGDWFIEVIVSDGNVTVLAKDRS